MIAVDTSALMAIVLDEADADLLISAGAVAEALIVASRRGVEADMARLIAGLGFQIVATTAAAADRMGEAYRAWGKGVHPASLNFGDCFAYALAKDHDCPSSSSAAISREPTLRVCREPLMTSRIAANYAIAIITECLTDGVPYAKPAYYSDKVRGHRRACGSPANGPARQLV